MREGDRIEPRLLEQRVRFASRPIAVELRFHQRIDGIIESERRPARARDGARDIEVKAARAFDEQIDLGAAQLPPLL